EGRRGVERSPGDDARGHRRHPARPRTHHARDRGAHLEGVLRRQGAELAARALPGEGDPRPHGARRLHTAQVRGEPEPVPRRELEAARGGDRQGGFLRRRGCLPQGGGGGAASPASEPAPAPAPAPPAAPPAKPRPRPAAVARRPTPTPPAPPESAVPGGGGEGVAAARGGGGGGDGSEGDGSGGARVAYGTNPLPPYPPVARRPGKG